MNIGSHIQQWLTERFSVAELTESQADIQQFFASALGQRILEQESTIADETIPALFGYHLMNLSALEKTELASLSPINHQFSLSVKPQTSSQAVARFEQLPIDAETLDVAVLQHVLEYSTDPHQLLREVARTVIANGYIIITGLNPWGLLTISKLTGQVFTRKSRWRYHYLNRSRILDWLRLLDFEATVVTFTGHGVPLNKFHHPRVDKFLSQYLSFTGAAYVIVARKRVLSVMPIKQPWRKKVGLTEWVKGGVVSGKTSASSEVTKDMNDQMKNYYHEKN